MEKGMAVVYQGNEERILSALDEIKIRFVQIALNLKELEQSKYFESLGYVKFVDYAEDKFGFSATMTRNLIAVQRTFCIGNTLKSEYKDYCFSQLVEMIPLIDKNCYLVNNSWRFIEKEINPSMTVKQLREYKKKVMMKDKPVVIPVKPVDVSFSKEELKENPTSDLVPIKTQILSKNFPSFAEVEKLKILSDDEIVSRALYRKGDIICFYNVKGEVEQREVTNSFRNASHSVTYSFEKSYDSDMVSHTDLIAEHKVIGKIKKISTIENPTSDFSINNLDSGLQDFWSDVFNMRHGQQDKGDYYKSFCEAQHQFIAIIKKYSIDNIKTDLRYQIRGALSDLSSKLYCIATHTNYPIDSIEFKVLNNLRDKFYEIMSKYLNVIFDLMKEDRG